MTMPDERARAVESARKFLLDLLNPRITPKVPLIIRQRAQNVLRHYPWTNDIRRAAELAPDIFSIGSW